MDIEIDYKIVKTLDLVGDYTHDLQSYEVVVFSGIGEVLSTMSIHGDTGKPYAILANEDIHVNIRKVFFCLCNKKPIVNKPIILLY